MYYIIYNKYMIYFRNIVNIQNNIIVKNEEIDESNKSNLLNNNIKFVFKVESQSLNSLLENEKNLVEHQFTQMSSSISPDQNNECQNDKISNLSSIENGSLKKEDLHFDNQEASICTRSGNNSHKFNWNTILHNSLLILESNQDDTAVETNMHPKHSLVFSKKLPNISPELEIFLAEDLVKKTLNVYI